MRELPPEILSLIFTFVVDTNFFGRVNHQYSHWVGASFLTKVCSRWRTVALDTPEIWARICIYHEVYFPSREQKHLRLCVDRAKLFPLSMEVVLVGDINDPLPGLREDLIKEYTTLLREFTGSDWESLIVRMREVSPDVCRAVFEMVKGNLKSLRLLDVSFDVMEDMEPSRVWQGTATFPQLQTLRLHHTDRFARGTKSFRTVDNSIFPYSQLIHIHLDLNQSQEEILHVLRFCCQHVRSVQINSKSSSTDTIVPTISLPLLHSLVINSPFVHNIRMFISALTAPSLNSLSLSSPGMDPNMADLNLSLLSQTLIHLLERSGVSGSLQKLHLSIHGVVNSSSLGPLISILEVMTGLKELRLNVSEHGVLVPVPYARVFDFLRALVRDDTLLPKLKHLHIQHVDDSNWQISDEPLPRRLAWVDDFERMVELRSAHELRSVVLETTDDGSVLDLKRLKRLQEERPWLVIKVMKTL